ncbi:MAG: 50S ribosomal protein L23 [Desulfurococcales archaeon]|nr:50S ribosomal protein L23 [Desulfurococcales archaeon]
MKDPLKIIIAPVSTEKVSNLVEKENTITLIVSKDATRNEVKYAVEKLYQVKVAGVRILITPKGEKKAYVRISSEFDASELASRLGIV